MILHATDNMVIEAKNYCAKVKASHRLKYDSRVTNYIFKLAEIVMAYHIASWDIVEYTMYENENEVSSAPHIDKGDITVITTEHKKFVLDIKTRLSHLNDLIVDDKDLKPDFIYVLVKYHPPHAYEPLGFLRGNFIKNDKYEWRNRRCPHIKKYLVPFNTLIPFQFLKTIFEYAPAPPGIPMSQLKLNNIYNYVAWV